MMLDNAMEDRRAGALYGQAIGDALGMPYEFDVKAPRRPDDVRYDPPGFAESSHGFLPGDWTDDTQQALAIAKALSIAEGFSQALRGDGSVGTSAARRIAAALLEWRRTATDCGNLTASVLSAPGFAENPQAAARAVWKAGRAQGWAPASNGGLMRTVGAAIVCPWDAEWTFRHAELACACTHADSRCVASAVAGAVAMAAMIRGRDIGWALDAAEEAGASIEPGSQAVIAGSGSSSATGGFTYTCLRIAFKALRTFAASPSPDRFAATLRTVVALGGDTDTNAAVAGALMGAHLGLSRLPGELLDGLRGKEKLDACLAAQPPCPAEG